jgi:hypothetical protein
MRTWVYLGTINVSLKNEMKMQLENVKSGHQNSNLYPVTNQLGKPRPAT